MQRLRLPVASATSSTRHGRAPLVVQAFLGRTHLHKAAKCMPSPFFRSQEDQCPVDLLAPEAKIKGSHWANDYLPSDTQGAAAIDYISRLQTAYTPATNELFVAADENTQNAFVFFTSQLVNTGNFANAPPTNKPSTVMGLYRLQCEHEGDLVSDVWLFRSGTEEERQYLLRQGLVNTHPVHEWAATEAISGSSSEATSQSISLTPCTWVVDHPLATAMIHNAGLWTKEVMSQGCMTSMMRAVSGDIVMYDGTGLLHDPLQGPAAVGHNIVDMITRCDMAPRVLSAQVHEQNKIFQHWKQARTCRTSGKHSQIQGATLLVFDSKARVKQAFEFMSLDNDLHGHIFDEEAAKRLLGCWPEPACNTAAAQAEAERAKAEEARLQAECLKRQEMEWISW